MFALKSSEPSPPEDKAHLDVPSDVCCHDQSPSSPLDAPRSESSPTTPHISIDLDALNRPRQPMYNFQGDIMQWYIRTISIKGIPIDVHPLLLVLWVISTLQGAVYGALGAAYYCLMYGPILCATVLVHELGHSLMALRHGQVVDRILLWPLGGLAFIGHTESATPQADLQIALAGPLTHVPQLVFWLLLSFVTGGVYMGYVSLGRGFFAAICSGAILINITLFLFNLCLPCYPLDGGRVLVAILLMRGVSVETTAKACVYISAAISFFGLIYGIANMDSFMIFIAIWVAFQIYQMWIILKAGAIREHPLFKNTTLPQQPAV